MIFTIQWIFFSCCYNKNVWTPWIWMWKWWIYEVFSKKKLTASIRLRRHMELVHKRDEKSSHKKLEYYSYRKKKCWQKTSPLLFWYTAIIFEIKYTKLKVRLLIKICFEEKNVLVLVKNWAILFLEMLWNESSLYGLILRLGFQQYHDKKMESE